MTKLNVRAFGLTLGIVWAAAILIMGVLSTCCNYGIGFIKAISTVYIGTNTTLLGAVIGAGWGFLDAGIGGLIIAWLYNKLSK